MAYFVRIKGRAFGPYDETQLLEMKSKGKITRSTEISENKHDWKAAESFYFLYEPLPTPQQPSGGSESADWFYSMNGTDGYGPVTATAIEQMLQSGQLTANCYVWQQGENARFIKNEPQFTNPGGSNPGGSGGIRHPASPDSGTGNRNLNIGGEITGTSEMVDTGQMIRPLAASLGWLMFLKITFLLLGIIGEGLFLLWWGGFSISRAIAADEAMVLFIVLITIVLWAGLYALQFKTFLCFWKYHNELCHVVATGRASALIQANQSLFLFWKWLGITAIANLAVIVIAVTTVVIASGFFIGFAQRIFGF